MLKKFVWGNIESDNSTKKKLIVLWRGQLLETDSLKYIWPGI